MTLKTCYQRLELAKAKGDSIEIKFWEDRIATRLTHKKYIGIKPKVEEKPKEVKKKNAKKA